MSILSKIPERVGYNRISNFVEKNHILTLSQHGFRSGKSVETASCHLLEHVYQCLDEGKYVVSLMFDLSKAFDTVNKEILSLKLHSIGIRGNILSWLMSYMESRSLVVHLNGEKSDVHDVELGVPQGSVLGPLLFMLYINDLPCHMKNCHVTMFADDTTITVSANTPEELQSLVGNTIELLSTWCQRNKLILNEKKTVLINFHLQRPVPNHIVLYENVTRSESAKLLGTFLDHKLSWTNHVDHVCKKLNKAYFAMLQLKSTLDKDSLVNIYYSLAYSHLSFNIMAWGRTIELQRVFVGQKKLSD